MVLAQLHGAGLNFTENRRIILSVFLAATEPVTITDLWLRAKRPITEVSIAPFGDC